MVGSPISRSSAACSSQPHTGYERTSQEIRPRAVIADDGNAGRRAACVEAAAAPPPLRYARARDPVDPGTAPAVLRVVVARPADTRMTLKRIKAPLATAMLRRVVLVILFGCSTLLGAADLSAPVILVAKPHLRGNLFSSTVLVVTPLGGDQHVGFIVNRPTNVTLGKLFPEHGPLQKVPAPLYFGGPFDSQVIFALVQRPDS